MKKKATGPRIPVEIIMNKIMIVRGRKVMIDSDLAELYGVATKRLNEQLKRNIKRFPKDFMFTLNPKEKNWIIENYPHLNKLKFSNNLPFVFTEHGAVMLASVLNSQRAIEVNIQVVRIFTRIREMLLTNKEILLKLEQMESRVTRHNKELQDVFDILRQLLQPKPEPRRNIGFRLKDE